MCHYDRGFRPFAGQANVSNPVFRREQVRKRLGSKLEEKRKVKLAKLKHRIYMYNYEKVGLTRPTVGKQKYGQCPIHILVFMVHANYLIFLTTIRLHHPTMAMLISSPRLVRARSGQLPR